MYEINISENRKEGGRVSISFRVPTKTHSSRIYAKNAALGWVTLGYLGYDCENMA